MNNINSNNSTQSQTATGQIPWQRIGLQKIIVSVVVFVIAAAILSFLLGAFNGFADNPEPTNDPGDAVRIISVKVAPSQLVSSITKKRKYTGTIRAKQQAALGFELTGRVEKVFCDEGDVVSKGDQLALLDTKTLDARRETTKASLDSAIAFMDELKEGPRQQTIDSVEAQLDEAKSDLKLAQITFDRKRKLQSSGSISDSEFDAADYSVQAAEARVKSIEKQLDELEQGTRKEKLDAQKAIVKQIDSQLKEVDVQIEKSTLVAPFDGKIVSRMIDPGGIASASVPVLKIVDSANLEAVIGIPVETSHAITSSGDYKIFVDGQPHQAKLLAKIQELDVTTRTQSLIFQLEAKAQESVIPGQLCQIEIATTIEHPGHWVPSAALTSGIRGLWSLLVVDPDTSKVKRCDVTVVYTEGDQSLVQGTIDGDALIVIEGTHRIVEGQLVKPISIEASSE